MNYVEDDKCLMKNKCPVCFNKLVRKFKLSNTINLIFILSLVITNENESRG
jgi:hypothetical protein